MNKFIGCGHLGRDPSLKKAQSGLDICTFTVAISGSEKVNGNWEKVTEWVDCVAFGKQAEWLSEAQKGDLVIFEGRLKTRSWEKDGVKKYKTEIICDAAQAVKKQAKEPYDTTPQTVGGGDFEDEILF